VLEEVPAVGVNAALERYRARVEDWPGWFTRTDRDLFGLVDVVQQRAGLDGKLLEIGVYLGKSAALLGCFRRGEELVVCDVFDDVCPDAAENRREMYDQYASLTRTEFERRYRDVHGELPTVIAALSSALAEAQLPRAFRFAHIDGSHSYPVVRDDIRLVRDLLVRGGIVALDDWRTAHTPGVHAAIWGAVHQDGLVPLVVSDAKMYATFSPLRPEAVAFRDAVSDSSAYPSELHDVAGQLLVRIVECLS
jgi:hypothetical protein